MIINTDDGVQYRTTQTAQGVLIVVLLTGTFKNNQIPPKPQKSWLFLSMILFLLYCNTTIIPI